jgi:hypothetical protein
MDGGRVWGDWWVQEWSKGGDVIVDSGMDGGGWRQFAECLRCFGGGWIVLRKVTSWSQA